MNYTTLQVLLRPAFGTYEEGIAQNAATLDAWISQTMENYSEREAALGARYNELFWQLAERRDDALAAAQADGDPHGYGDVDACDEERKQLEIAHHFDIADLFSGRDASIARANEWYNSLLDGLRAEFMIALIDAVHLAGTPAPAPLTDGE